MNLMLEVIAVTVQVLQLIVVIFGLLLALRQLRVLTAEYKDQHEWNRRNAAQDALKDYFALGDGLKLIHHAFDYLQANDRIPLEKIKEKCDQTPELRAAIHRFLKETLNKSTPLKAVAL